MHSVPGFDDINPELVCECGVPVYTPPAHFLVSHDNDPGACELIWLEHRPAAAHDSFLSIFRRALIGEFQGDTFPIAIHDLRWLRR